MASLWDELVKASSPQEARKVACFLECWAVTGARLGRDPSPEEVAAEWGYTTGEVGYYQREVSRLFPGKVEAVLATVKGVATMGLAAMRTLEIERS